MVRRISALSVILAGIAGSGGCSEAAGDDDAARSGAPGAGSGGAGSGSGGAGSGGSAGSSGASGGAPTAGRTAVGGAGAGMTAGGAPGAGAPGAGRGGAAGAAGGGGASGMCASPSSGGAGGQGNDVPVGRVDWCAGDGCPKGECDAVFGEDCDVVYPCGVDASSMFCAPGASGSYCLTVVNTNLDYYAITCADGEPAFDACLGGCGLSETTPAKCNEL